MSGFGVRGGVQAVIPAGSVSAVSHGARAAVGKGRSMPMHSRSRPGSSDPCSSARPGCLDQRRTGQIGYASGVGSAAGRRRGWAAVRTPRMPSTVDVRRGPRNGRAGREQLRPNAPDDEPPAPARDPTPRMDEQHVETWQLVAPAQEGDGEAFGQLYDRYVDIVYRFVYYRVNDRALAEDFTSETFLRACVGSARSATRAATSAPGSSPSPATSCWTTSSRRGTAWRSPPPTPSRARTRAQPRGRGAGSNGLRSA